MSEKERNLRLAETILAEFTWNGQTFREGQYVALLDGKVVAVDDKPENAISALRAIDPDPKRGMVIEVSLPEMDIIR
jgi:Family of unknown function (DUF5678)